MCLISCLMAGLNCSIINVSIELLIFGIFSKHIYRDAMATLGFSLICKLIGYVCLDYPVSNSSGDNPCLIRQGFAELHEYNLIGSLLKG